jgi:hypothetical protein
MLDYKTAKANGGMSADARTANISVCASFDKYVVDSELVLAVALPNPNDGAEAAGAVACGVVLL